MIYRKRLNIFHEICFKAIEKIAGFINHCRVKQPVSLSVCFAVLCSWVVPGSASAQNLAQTLPNGLRYTLKERHSLPLVSLCLIVDAGSRSELPGEEGAAHLLEHWLFKGAGSRKRGEIDRDIELLGGTLSAMTTADSMRLSVTLPAAHWREALPILADLVSRATLPTEEFEREKRVVGDELALRQSDALEAQIADRYTSFFPNHPYAHVPGGTPQTISRLTSETVWAFYRRNYLPSRCVLSLCGDFLPEEAETAIRRNFTAKENAGSIHRLTQINTDLIPNFQHPTPNTQHPDSLLAFPLPPASLRRLTATVNMIAELLGDERGGRLQSVSSVPLRLTTRFTPRKENALFFVQGEAIGASRSLPENFEVRVREAIVSLKTRPPTSSEMALAQKSLSERLRGERETVAEVAQANGTALLIGGDTPEELEARAITISPSEIANFIGRYWQIIEPKTDFVEPVLPYRPKRTLPFKAQPPSENSQKPVRTTSVTLTNGTRLVMTLLPDAASCTVTALIATDPDVGDEQNALGLLVSRAVFFGSRHQSFDSIAYSVGRTGGDLEFLRGPEFVAFTVQTREESLRDAAYLLSEALKNAEFTPEALERARQQIATERAANLKRPRSFAEQTLGERLFGGAGEEFEKELRRVTPERALAYFQSHYFADRTVISVAGAFDPKAVGRLFDNNLFDYERRSVKPLKIGETPTFVPFSETVVEAKSFPDGGAHLFLITPAPPLDSTDYPAFLVLSAILGRGNGSRLFSEIRDAKGNGYEIGANLLSPQKNALFIGLGWDAKRSDFTPKDALAEVEAQLLRLTQSPPTTDELRRAVALLVGTEWLRREKPRECAFLLGLYELNKITGRASLSADTLEKTLQRVTPGEVLRVARRFLPNRYALLSAR